MAQYTFSCAISPQSTGIWGATFSDARNAADAYVTNSAVLVYCQKSSTYDIYRAVITFDTSSIPDGATIQSAKLKFTGGPQGEGAVDSIHAVSATPASNTTLTTADYDQRGSTSFGSISNSSIDANTAFEIDLNASGIANISKTGYSKFALIYGADLNNSAPTANGIYQYCGTATLYVDDDQLSPSPSATPSPSSSKSLSPSASPSRSQSRSQSRSLSRSPSKSISLSKSLSPSASLSKSPSLSESFSPSPAHLGSYLLAEDYWAVLQEIGDNILLDGISSISLSPSASPSRSISLSQSRSVSASPSPSSSLSLSESRSKSLSPSVSQSRSISLSQSRSVSASESPSSSQSRSISLSQSLSPSRSISLSQSLSPSVSQSRSISLSQSVSPSQSQSRSISLSPSVSISLSESRSASRSLSLSPSVSPSVGFQEYTKTHVTPLPSDNTDLATAFSNDEYTYVATIDNTTTDIASDQGDYMIQQFKDFAVGDATECFIQWYGQSTINPVTEQTVYLQIYNVNTASWETIDQNPITFGMAFAKFGGDHRYFGGQQNNEYFYLKASITDLTNYKDAQKIVSCRVYQKDVLPS